MAAITLKQLEAFVAVADLGTFRRAAERLHTTQPNISNRIAQLEAQLRAVLMDRDAGSVRLTPRGQAVLAQARTVLAGVEALILGAGDRALVEGTLRLGVSELVAHTWLRPFLLQMRARFPSVQVELTVDLSANLSQALFQRDLDLVFQNGPFDRPAPGTAPLGQSPYAWVASPALGLGDTALDARAISARPILTHSRKTVPFQQLDAYFRSLGITARLVPSSNIAACLQMTVDGLGIACLPQAMLAPYLADGRLDLLQHDWTPAELRFAARYIADPAPAYLHEAVAIAQGLSRPEVGADDKESVSSA